MADFEQRLAPRNVIAPVTVQEDQAAESLLEEVLCEAGQDIEISPGRCGKGSLKIEVMVGIAEPQERDEEHLRCKARPDALDELSQEQAVGEHRQVVAMLFECGNGDHHRDVPRE